LEQRIFRIQYTMQVNDKIRLTLQGGEITSSNKEPALAVPYQNVSATLHKNHIIFHAAGRRKWISNGDMDLYNFDIRNGLNIPKKKANPGWTIADVWKILKKNNPYRDVIPSPLFPIAINVEMLDQVDPNIRELLSWGFTMHQAEKTLGALNEGKKIVLVGPSRSGKSKLLNQLIRLQNSKFYFLHGKESNIEIEPDNQKKRTDDLGAASFFIIDDVGKTTLLKQLAIDGALVAEMQTINDPDPLEKFPDNQIALYADLFILTNAYKNIADIREVTAADKQILEQQHVDKGKGNFKSGSSKSRNIKSI
jgi:hypothetical protein